jgi:hypothetical protein
MENQINPRELIQQNLHQEACPFCGGKTYQLVLRTSGTLDDPSLFVRCRQCSRPRSLNTDFKRVLWI